MYGNIKTVHSPLFFREIVQIQRVLPSMTAILIFKCTEAAGVGDYIEGRLYSQGLQLQGGGNGERRGQERSGFEVRVRLWFAIFFLFVRNVLKNRSNSQVALIKMAPTVYDKEIFAVVVASSLLSWWPCLHTIREILFTSQPKEQTLKHKHKQTKHSRKLPLLPNLERLGSSDRRSGYQLRHNHSNHIRLAHQVVVNIGDRKTSENMGSTIAGKNRAKMAESLWRDTHCKFCKMQFRYAFCLEKRVKCDLAPFLKTS